MDDKHTGRHAGTDAAAGEGGDIFLDKAADDELSAAELVEASGGLARAKNPDGLARAKNPDDKSSTEDGRLTSW